MKVSWADLSYTLNHLPKKSYSRKRLRVSGKGDQDGSRAKKRKRVSKTVAKVQDSPPSDQNNPGDDVDRLSEERDELDDLLADSD